MADRLSGGHHSSSQRRYSDPTLLSGSSALSDFYNTQSANTQIGTRKELHPKRVMGPARPTQRSLRLIAGVLGKIGIRTVQPNTRLRRTLRTSRRNGRHTVTMTMVATYRSRQSRPQLHPSPQPTGLWRQHIEDRWVKLDLFMEFLLG